MAATDFTEAGTGAPAWPCARIGCRKPAVASFTFEAKACLVWIDPISESTRGAGLLCAVHADRLTPPRGWNLQDRRASAPRLWADRPTVSPADTAPTRNERAPRSRPRETSARLPFAIADRADVPPLAVPEATETVARVRSEIERVLDARSPLLERAFAGARQAEQDAQRAT